MVHGGGFDDDRGRALETRVARRPQRASRAAGLGGRLARHGGDRPVDHRGGRCGGLGRVGRQDRQIGLVDDPIVVEVGGQVHARDAEGDDRAGWIINLTNDGWFGISTGPYQHLQQARLRAIEEGLPVVRAANTGISAVIDPLGRIVAQLGLGIEGVLDANLPSAIAPTIYARYANIPAATLLLIALIFVVYRRAKQQDF